MRFGEYLKSLRMEKELSLRDLAKKSDMDFANLSRIERDLASPPQRLEVLDKLVDALELSSEQKQRLLDLSAVENGVYPFDVKEDLGKHPNLPILLRTISNKKLSADQILELTDRINEEY